MCECTSTKGRRNSFPEEQFDHIPKMSRKHSSARTGFERVCSVVETIKGSFVWCDVPLDDDERAKVQKDLDYQQGFLRSVRGKLSNEKFVNGAPEQVVENERKKEADALAKIAVLEEKLADLG